MTATTATTTARTTRKVLGSLGVIGAAAAVAGMGTFGSFTDSTTPLAASVTSGTLDIELTGQNASATLPTMTVAGFVPGDSISRPVDLTNKGSLALNSISLTSVATGTPSILTTDTTNGLKVGVTSCPVNWVESTPNNWTCSSTPATVVATTPVITNALLAGAASVNPGSVNAPSTDHLLLTVSLPAAADNTFQGKTGAVSFTFVGTQKTGTNR
jgi:hypothetical protein